MSELHIKTLFGLIIHFTSCIFPEINQSLAVSEEISTAAVLYSYVLFITTSKGNCSASLC